MVLEYCNTIRLVPPTCVNVHSILVQVPSCPIVNIAIWNAARITGRAGCCRPCVCARSKATRSGKKQPSAHTNCSPGHVAGLSLVTVMNATLPMAHVLLWATICLQEAVKTYPDKFWEFRGTPSIDHTIVPNGTVYVLQYHWYMCKRVLRKRVNVYVHVYVHVFCSQCTCVPSTTLFQSESQKVALESCDTS